VRDIQSPSLRDVLRGLVAKEDPDQYIMVVVTCAPTTDSLTMTERVWVQYCTRLGNVVPAFLGDGLIQVSRAIRDSGRWCVTYELPL
jgi:hypothetical protein